MEHYTTVTYRGAFKWMVACSCGWESSLASFLERDAERIGSDHEKGSYRGQP